MSQYVCGHHRDSGASRNSGKSLLRAGFSVGERIPAQHNRNQAAHFRDRSCEESLNGCETCIKRRTPGLSVSRQWKQEKGEQ